MNFPAEFTGYLGVLIIGGIFFIAYGFMYIFGKNQVWKLQSALSRVRRKSPPERTPEWNRRTTASGFVAILFGLFAIIFALLLPAALSSLQQAIPAS